MFSAQLGKVTRNLPGGRKLREETSRNEREEERWSGRAEERSEDRQNSLVRVAPHPDDRDRETDERADERVEVIEPDGSTSPRRPRGPQGG
jgi:hypothetical protein